MKEQDIRGSVLSILGHFMECQKIEKVAVQRGFTKEEHAKIEAEKEQALVTAMNLAANVLVNLNDIAEALKFVAEQHNSSDVLFRG